MAIKIYTKNNFVVVDSGTKINYLSSSKTDFDPLDGGKYVLWNTDRPSESYSFLFTEVTDESGLPIGGGTEAEVVEYISSVASSISSTTITGNVSVPNSTTTLLGIGEVFIGEAELNSHQDVMVFVKSSNNGTLYMEFSIDGTNWDTSLSFIYDTTRINPPHVIVKGSRYYRTRFVNTSGTAQTVFRLQTEFGAFNKLTAPLNGTLSENYDAIATRPSNYIYEVSSGKRQGSELWNKFGYNRDIGIGTEVIASWGGTFTPRTTATTISIVSTSALDTNGGTGCEGVVVYGIDANRNPVIEVVMLNGTTPVVTTSTWLGINRLAMFRCGSTTVNQGTITASAVTLPSTMAQMPSMGGVTQQCIFYIPANYRFNSNWLFINALNKGKAATLTIKMWVYSTVSNGKQEVFSFDIDTDTTTEPFDLSPIIPFPITEKTVMWLECTSDKAAIIVNARFSGILERMI